VETNEINFIFLILLTRFDFERKISMDQLVRLGVYLKAEPHAKGQCAK
jgi:hypothetical protein